MIIKYSRYPGPTKVRVIRETLETPKQPQELNNIFLLVYFILQYPYLQGYKTRITETINKYILQT